MKNKKFFIILSIIAILSFNVQKVYSSVLIDSTMIMSNPKLKGAYFTGKYPDLFKELLGKNELEIKSKIDSAFDQLFYGNDSTQRVYYSVGDDMAYIKDIGSDDIRTEGMSYGMMITVQMDKKSEFDRLWKWAKTYMQHKDGKHEDYFAWQCNVDGSIIDSNSASDGEEWFVMALFFASARWPNGKGIYDYKAEAQKILDAMLGKAESSDDRNVVTDMFNKKEKQVVFVPAGQADDFTDPSYHLPHYYELWARFANKNNRFWCEAADSSRKFLMKVVNPITGLTPNYARFNGSPYSFLGGGNENFQFDAWRVAMNVALDYSWFAKSDSQRDMWEVNQSNRLLDFFYSQGIDTYGNGYTLDGKKISDDHSTGLVAMNAVAALASTNENRKEFVEALWNVKIPDGHWRYYDGLLYMMGLLQVSGNFRIYDPTGNTVSDYSGK